MLVTNGKESTASKILKLVFAPIITAFLAFGGSYIAMHQRQAALDTTVKEMATDVRDMKIQQTALFKDYYLPRREEWNDHANKLNRIQAEHDFMQRQVNDIYSNINRLHGGK
jgi:hypothetical protein